MYAAWFIFYLADHQPCSIAEFHHPVYMASDFVLTQIFMVCGIYLTHKMNQVNMASDQLLDQKKQLWG